MITVCSIACRRFRTVREGNVSMGLIVALLVIWLALVIVGFAVKALLWLAIVGIVLFVATGIFGAIRRRAS